MTHKIENNINTLRFETERTILRPWEESDAEECFKYSKDPLVGPICGWPVHKDIEQSKKVIKDILSNPETYAIVWKETGLPIGSIGLHFDSDLAKRMMRVNWDIGWGFRIGGGGLFRRRQESCFDMRLRI